MTKITIKIYSSKIITLTISQQVYIILNKLLVCCSWN